LSTVDLSEVFWHLIVEPQQKYNFCYVMPNPPGSRVRIVVPSALQMVWAESPAYFCAATKTGCDIIKLLPQEQVELPEHPSEKFMEPTDTPKMAPPNEEHTSIGVYVDDYMLALVESDDRTLLRQVSRATLLSTTGSAGPYRRQGPDITARSWRRATRASTLKRKFLDS
jgi:hypothetical protein